MSTQAPVTVGDGASLAYSLDGTTWVTLASIESINGNKPTAAEVKTTKLDSTNNAETSQPGRVDYGEIAIKIRWAKAITTLVLGWMANKTILFFRTTVIDSATTQSSDAIQGWVKEFDPFGELQDNKEVISDIKIKCTGADTFTAGS